MPSYLVEFERIGRNRGVRPMTFAVDGEADLSRSLRAVARQHLRSTDFDVMLDMEAGTGWFACGMHSGGNFSITPVKTSEPDYGPAMTVRHTDKGYPFGDRVPKRVRMTKTVTSDFIPGTTINGGDDPLVAINATTFAAWTNSYGAVAVHTPDGRKLGVKPDEFEVVEWHQF